MSINTKYFLSKLRIASIGLGNPDGVETQASFSFLNGVIYTYNGYCLLRVSLEGIDEVKGTALAAKFTKFIETIRKPDLEFSTDEKSATLELKSGFVRFPLCDTDVPLHEVPDPDTWIPLPENFINQLTLAVEFTNKDQENILLSCIHITEKHIEATDRHSVVRCILRESMPGVNLCFPAETVQIIKRVDATKYCVTNSWLHFKSDEAVVVSCRTVPGDFPNIENILKLQMKSKIILPDAIIHICQRAETLIGPDGIFVAEIKKGRIGVKIKEEGVNFEESARVVCPEEVSFQISPKNLMKAASESLGLELCGGVGKDGEKMVPCAVRYSDKTMTVISALTRV